MTHIDNMKILKALIYAKDDLQPLMDGATKRRVCFSSIHTHTYTYKYIEREIEGESFM